MNGFRTISEQLFTSNVIPVIQLHFRDLIEHYRGNLFMVVLSNITQITVGWVPFCVWFPSRILSHVVSGSFFLHTKKKTPEYIERRILPAY